MQANGIPRLGGIPQSTVSGCCKVMVAIPVPVLVPAPSSWKKQLITNDQDLFLRFTFCFLSEVKL